MLKRLDLEGRVKLIVLRGKLENSRFSHGWLAYGPRFGKVSREPETSCMTDS